MLLLSLATDGMWAWWCSTCPKTISGEPGQTLRLCTSYANCRRHLDLRLGPEVRTSPKRRKASHRAGRGTVQPQLHSGIADWRVAFLGRVKNWPDPFPKEFVLRFISSVEFMNLGRYQEGKPFEMHSNHRKLRGCGSPPSTRYFSVTWKGTTTCMVQRFKECCFRVSGLRVWICKQTLGSNK